MSAEGFVREELVEPLRRTLAWLASLDRGGGELVCPDHRVEHTGKNCGAAVIACVLSRVDRSADGEKLFSIARQQGRRMVANLVREGDSPCHTFRPGRHDPFNCSNSVIDGGACSDALAEIVRTFGPRLPADERERFAAASVLHARTYLRYAVLDKGIPAQRAWGLTGLAGAFSLARDADLERAAIEAFGLLEGIQNADGSYPYHPLEWGGEHEGSADVSAFYQSRVTAFLMFALERLGRDPRGELFAAPLRRGLDFLWALQGPDGIKCGLLEAKPWYWGATYEVASHPFDAYALARGCRWFDSPRLGQAALLSFRAWREHLGADGRPASHRDGPGRGRSYQCPVFWAGHAGWMARALPDLERILSASRPAAPAGGAGLEIAVCYFPDASLARIEDGAVVAWIRGRRPAYNVHHGSPHGAGLLRALHKRDLRELVERAPLAAAQEAEWSGQAGRASPLRGWRSGAGELRFGFWLARNHWRGRRYRAALGAGPALLRRGVVDFASSGVSSAFAIDPQVHLLPDGVRLESALAWRGGRTVPRSRLERLFQVDGDGLVVTERLLERGAARGVEYRLPARAQVLEREVDLVRYRLG